MSTLADVLFPIALRRTLSYSVPAEMQQRLVSGSFVYAPLGNRKILGIVTNIYPLALETGAAPRPLKPIDSIAEEFLSIHPQRLALWKWISEYYLCTLGEVMKAAMLPSPPAPPTFAAIPASVAPKATGILSLPTLLKQQQITDIQSLLDTKGVVLLQGGAKRTEIYIHLLHQCLQSGKNGLLLVPEVGVCEQIYETLAAIFGSCVFLFHSRLTPAKRRRTLQSLAQRESPAIVIGLRSALLFTDLQNTGLLIVDDEQDPSYKQTDPAPRFHARDLAVVAGRLYQAPVLLGSACAGLETEYNVRTGKYASYILAEENPGPAPEIDILDTRRLFKKKQMLESIAMPLLQAIQKCFDVQEQVLLFTQNCAQLHEQLQALLPDNRIARLDESHTPLQIRKLLALFKNKEIELLIGTPSMHKGLHFEHIGLVGVLEADKQLSRHDFRAHERAYQTLSLLFGHICAQRSGTHPQMMIQSAQTDQPLYLRFQEDDRESFVTEQLQERKDFNYPPFVRLVAVRFKHPHPETAALAAQEFAQHLPAMGITDITGPFAPLQYQEQKLHTQLLWLRLPRHPHSEVLKKELFNMALAQAAGRVQVQIDVDPF